MRPSSTVWKKISGNLHPPRRRYGLLLAFVGVALTTVAYFTIHPFNKAVPISTANLQQPGLIKNQTPPSASSAATSANVSEKQHSVARRETSGAKSGRNLTAVIPAYATGSERKLVNLSSIGNMPGLQESTDATNALRGATAQYDLPPTAPSSSLDLQNAVTTHNAPLVKTKKRKKALALQFYFTPTVSYRKLGENKSFLRSQSTSNPNYAPAFVYDVNNVVTHRPDLGLELGMALKYPLTNKLSLRGGMQFNVNRYNIKAYNATLSMATIMLNGSRADSLRMLSAYSNTKGYKQDWLENYYFQISAPVGVEYRLFNGKKVQWGVATTFQPTYVAGDRAYAISTDYKNYIEVPQLVRRWNVNTTFETFVGYSTGKLSWQVGPQVRYQLLSSFVDAYPVKENLFDFGLKIGITINKNQ